MTRLAFQIMEMLAPTRPVRPDFTWGYCRRCGHIAYWQNVPARIVYSSRGRVFSLCECGHIGTVPTFHGGPTLELSREELAELPELGRRYPAARAVWEETVKHLIG